VASGLDPPRFRTDRRHCVEQCQAGDDFLGTNQTLSPLPVIIITNCILGPKADFTEDRRILNLGPKCAACAQ